MNFLFQEEEHWEDVSERLAKLVTYVLLLIKKQQNSSRDFLLYCHDFCLTIRVPYLFLLYKHWYLTKSLKICNSLAGIHRKCQSGLQRLGNVLFDAINRNHKRKQYPRASEKIITAVSNRFSKYGYDGMD